PTRTWATNEMKATISTEGARSARRYRVVMLARRDEAARMVALFDDVETSVSVSLIRRDPFAKNMKQLLYKSFIVFLYLCGFRPKDEMNSVLPDGQELGREPSSLC